MLLRIEQLTQSIAQYMLVTFLPQRVLSESDTLFSLNPLVPLLC